MASVTNVQCLNLARDVVACDSMESALDCIARFANSIPGKLSRDVGPCDERQGNVPTFVYGTWRYWLERFVDDMRNGILTFEIFATGGNSKLPFVAFSALPIVTCPGAGACAGISKEGDAPNLKRAFCYSIKAWRYPAGFLRQLQNTLLLKFDRRAIVNAFSRLKRDITLRLYVDGDFDSASTALFWFNMLTQRPDIQAYGYSKSWRILSQLAHRIPTNYTLNLSSGGIDDSNDSLRQFMREMGATRGEFVAVQIKGEFARGFARYSDPAYHRAVREAAQRSGLGKVFSCPGNCGNCTGKGHACGARNADGLPLVSLPIAIGIH